ncbi:MAG TPA: dihydropteroate synthase [Syntrophales bacterium]|nr:dihydropteroate synthase [Syntrophales bacterium]HQG33619.1 dihydropteroate synthase [Syntrophales bacterium]HQI35768.1 dihydropteroate synthase [Syntrophales bacterium]HRR48255.1 dihydropteroate synthase [Syntrophales bacterium]HRU88801.1 dihydropteroate synthase [Syntrophales bacterium]
MWFLRDLSINTPSEAVQVLKDTGVDPSGIEAMLPKMKHLNIHLEEVSCPAANIIKQEMLAVGGDAAVARGAVSCRLPATDVVLMGTKKQLRRFAGKISGQPFGLSALSASLIGLLETAERTSWTLSTARRELDLGPRTLVMGIVNVTPDSFSDGGRYFHHDLAVEHALRLVGEGADILDIGGESSRPGATPVSPTEELDRVIPVVAAVAGQTDVPISIDTTKAIVAREAVAAGAEIINDISAMRFDEEMPVAVRETGAAIVLMHMRGTPRDMQAGNPEYPSLWGEILRFLAGRIEVAGQCGIPEERIVVDPGLGFGKTAADNLKMIRELKECRALGRPVLMGPSRKSFLGRITGAEPQARQEETIAAVTACILNGARLIRVHEVRAAKKAAAVADAIRGEGT